MTIYQWRANMGVGELSSENQNFISDLIQSGRYRTAGEALDQAVDLLKRRQRLVDDIEAGITQAENGDLIPADQVFDHLEKRAEQIVKASNKG
jgi:putative addiction module CopG family antidote